MGLFDKVKNLFTEEIEEERPVKRELRHVEIEPKRTASPVEKEQLIEQSVRPSQPVVDKEEVKKEEKFVFFSDDDFKDLERPKREEIKKIEKKEEKPLVYKGAVPQTKPEPKKEFKPSPIISPVYGVLDQNYKKEDIKQKKSSPRVYRSTTVTIDDVRNKAYGTLEDDFKDDLLGKNLIEKTDEVIENSIDLFGELEKIEEDPVVISRSTDDVDEIFGKLDNKRDEILDELDNKKDEILDEIDNKKESLDLLTSDLDDKIELEDDSIDFKEEIDEDNIEEDTIALAQELEEQKKKLEEINSMMNENEKMKKTKGKKKSKPEIEENLDESELFDIIDSMYDKKDDE